MSFSVCGKSMARITRSWAVQMPIPRTYHRAAADRCEAMQQWFAAAWHLSQLQASKNDPPDVDLLLRRARAYAGAEDWARSIADYKDAAARGADHALYCEIARTCIEYAKASDPSQWDAAIEAYGKAATVRSPQSLDEDPPRRGLCGKDEILAVRARSSTSRSGSPSMARPNGGLPSPDG